MTVLEKGDKVWNFGFMGGPASPWYDPLNICYENGTVMVGLWFWA